MSLSLGVLLQHTWLGGLLHVYTQDPLSHIYAVDLIHIFRSWFSADQQLVAVTRKQVQQCRKNKHYELAHMGVNSKTFFSTQTINFAN